MKNAEYIESVIRQGGMSIEDKQQLIKRYGHECAKQALNDAVENYFEISSSNPSDRQVELSIFKTEIKTP